MTSHPMKSEGEAMPTRWKSPRCGSACWDEIKAHEANREALLQRLLDVTRDRNEWRQQHENLLAIRQAELNAAALRAAPGPDVLPLAAPRPFKETEGAIIDYFEVAGADVVEDGVEWFLSLYDEGPAISLTALAIALTRPAPGGEA